MVIEIDASNKAWGGILIEKHGDKEEICGYASRAFENTEIKYLSGHKEIFAVKKIVNHLKLYLELVKFIVRTDVKIMPRIFKNENLMEENSSRILKSFLWLQNFVFSIVYKPSYLNFFVDMLTREELQENPSLNMFSYGASILSNKISKARIFNDHLSEEEREYFLNCANKKEANKYLALSLIQHVNSSPLKIQISER